MKTFTKAQRRKIYFDLASSYENGTYNSLPLLPNLQKYFSEPVDGEFILIRLPEIGEVLPDGLLQIATREERVFMLLFAYEMTKTENL